MSCVLRVQASDIDALIRSSSLRPYRVAGNTAHFLASSASTTELASQAGEAVAFLESNMQELKKLAAHPAFASGVLDFAVCWGHGYTQTDHLPAGLLSLVGSLRLDIELSHYPVEEERHAAGA